MSVFRKKPLQERNLWQKMWRKRLSENFLIDLNNLLAEKELLKIRLDDVNRLCRRYRVGNISMYSRRLAGFYHSYLQYCLEDRLLSDQEIQELGHLKLLLGLSDRTVKEVHKSLTTAIYGQELEKVMSDDKIEREEFAFLKELGKNLYLPENLAMRILEDKAGKRLQRKLVDIMADKRITLEEEQDFELLSKNLGFKPGLDERTEYNFERYKIYWQVENANLPQLQPGIHLQPKEICHYQSEAVWYETNKDTSKLETSKLEGRIRVPRGIFWRSDNEDLSHIAATDWKLIDNGEILLTNKRLIYMGKMGRMVVLLENIIGLIPYNDAVFVKRKKGKSPIMEMQEDEASIFALMLNRLISESQ